MKWFWSALQLFAALVFLVNGIAVLFGHHPWVPLTATAFILAACSLTVDALGIYGPKDTP